MGDLKDSKVRLSFVIEKKDKRALERIADEDNRSLGNLINTILKEWLRKNEHKAPKE